MSSSLPFWLETESKNSVASYTLNRVIAAFLIWGYTEADRADRIGPTRSANAQRLTSLRLPAD
jgi:hypothetical protein